MAQCSLDPAAFAARLAEWGELDRALVSHGETPDGLQVQYRLEPGLAERLLELIAAEGQCCPGLTFEATVTVSVHSSG